MKRNLFLMMMLSLLFVQCKNDETDDEYVKTIPVTFELTPNSDKSVFYKILDFGRISWGNDNNTEYCYLAVPYLSNVNENGTLLTQRKGVMAELKLIMTSHADNIKFKGFFPKEYLNPGMSYELYYFGNNGNGTPGTNVQNIFDETTGEVIGKKISMQKQNGNIRTLGDYHIASVRVVANPIYDADGAVIGYNLMPEGMMKNKMSIALLDIAGETSLKGKATYNSTYMVKWNGYTFTETIGTTNDGFDVSDNVGEMSFISLLPNTDNNVIIECNKGSYTFVDGVEINTLYIGGGQTIDDLSPLPWNK